MDDVVVESSRAVVATPVEAGSACPGKIKLPPTSSVGANKIVVQKKDGKAKKEGAAPPAVVKATALRKTGPPRDHVGGEVASSSKDGALPRKAGVHGDGKAVLRPRVSLASLASSKRTSEASTMVGDVE